MSYAGQLTIDQEKQRQEATGISDSFFPSKWKVEASGSRKACSNKSLLTADIEERPVPKEVVINLIRYLPYHRVAFRAEYAFRYPCRFRNGLVEIPCYDVGPFACLGRQQPETIHGEGIVVVLERAKMCVCVNVRQDSVRPQLLVSRVAL